MQDLLLKTLDCLMSLTPQPPLTNQDFQLVAHRGNHETAIENTMEAFADCEPLKVAALEFDVRATKDKELVVHHDPHMGRLFQRPDLILSEISFSELRKEEPRVPRLEEVVDRFRSRFHLMIELKETFAQHSQEWHKLQEILAPMEPGSDYHILTLDPDHVVNLEFVPPKGIFLVSQWNIEDLFQKVLQKGYGGLAGHYLGVSERRKTHLKTKDRLVGSGFINTPRLLQREVARGIDWIFTDRPKSLLGRLPEISA